MRILFLATVPYHSPRQRPQQIADRLKGDVTYLSQWTLRNRSGVFVMPYSARSKAVRWLVYRLAFLRHIFGYVEAVRLARLKPDAIVTQSYFYYPIVRHFICPIIYDRIDDEDGFREVPLTVKKDLKRMYNISTQSATVRELLVDLGTLIPNGVDLSVWKAKKVVVYHGTIDWWFDAELVANCAVMMPEVTFLLIGPRNITVPKLSNVFCLGAIEHNALPAIVQHADAAIIPFKVNSLTATVDPVKLYEYRAMGIPVLATPFRRVPCMVTATADQFPFALKIILYSKSTHDQVLSEECGKLNTWDDSAKQMSDLIHSLVGR